MTGVLGPAYSIPERYFVFGKPKRNSHRFNKTKRVKALETALAAETEVAALPHGEEGGRHSWNRDMPL